jgi:hypothetical protein
MEQLKSHSTARENAMKLGYIISLIMTVLAIATFGIAICTPPVSGPFCQASCIEYPYTDIVSRFPRDYYWMYPAIFMVIFYLMLIVCIHHFVPDNKKIFTNIAFSFSIISSIALIIDYFIQVTSIQPGLLRGETDGITLLTQYNPHGVFIALEEIGYIMMNISFVCLVPVFTGTTKLERAIKTIFIISFILMTVAFIMISLKYGINREYIFEVAIITINYTVLIISGMLLGVLFKQELKKSIALRHELQNTIED